MTTLFFDYLMFTSEEGAL